ncbi:MAG: toll/interleukin-1 receptor domain-containing protein [Anaerolineales bacterium]|jgi:hypothetical protein|nr:toll/interleukin-1 receptor domain-containing protein [Anaerolineales bacterium]
MSDSGPDYDVFLSYNSKDEEIILAIARRLKDENINVWLDIWRMRPGRPCQEALEEALRASRSVVVFIGTSGFGRWENEEMRIAVDEQIRRPGCIVIPVLLPGSSQAHLEEKLFLNRNIPVNFRKGIDDSGAFRRLLAGIRGEEPGDFLPTVPTSPDPNQSEPAAFPPRQHPREQSGGAELLYFVNREDVIELILSSQSPAYHLLDAPAGFGKTLTLKKLQRHFDAADWVNGYVAVHHQSSLREVLSDFEIPLAVQLGADVSGESLAKALIAKWDVEFRSGAKKGIVLLVDVEKPSAMSMQIVRQLILEVIPPMAKLLHSHPSLQNRYNPFRLVIASRYLSSKLETGHGTNFVPHKLTSFNYETVRQAVQKYLDPQIIDRLGQLTAHLVFYTGGHPGCIASILTLYKQKHYPDPDLFFENCEDQVWDIIYPEIEDIRIGIDQDLRGIFDELSLFRCVDLGILHEILKIFPYFGMDDEFELQDKLREAYLMEPMPGGMFLKDGITRNMLALRLFASGGKKAFVYKCGMPQTICKQRLLNPETQLPAQWLVESYYQYLQKHIGAIQSGETRKRIRKEFFYKIIPEYFGEFAEGRRPCEYRMAIEQLLNEDWEFQFTVNYFLRELDYCDCESSSIYSKAKAQILALFY